MPLYKPPNPHAPVLSQFSLAGKVAAVTGGSKGIGLEIVRGLAEAGASVALIYSSTDPATAAATASQIAEATGSRVSAYHGDVRSRAGIGAAVDEAARDLGGLDVVVANSGVCADVPALEYDEVSWAAGMGVNLDGAMWTAQAAARHFRERGSGSLIFTASVSAGLVNVPQRQAAYNASKAAVVRLAKCLAVEWVDFARVNCVSPGFVETDMIYKQPKERFDKWMDMIPGKRLADAAELKGVYVFLASDACSYMTGADLVVDGGYTLT